jgi:hypothetical protein
MELDRDARASVRIYYRSPQESDVSGHSFVTVLTGDVSCGTVGHHRRRLTGHAE